MRTGRLTRTYLGGGSRQKVVNFPVDVDSTGQILDTANLGLDKMVAVDGGGDGCSVHARRHELENSHLNEWEDDVKTFHVNAGSRETYLSGGILARNALQREGSVGNETQEEG